MNKRILLSLLSFTVLVLSAYGQIVDYRALNRNTNPYKNQQRYSKPVKTNAEGKELIFKESMFISIGGGMQGLLVNEGSDGSFGDRSTFAPSLSIGTFFTPRWGVRLGFTGGDLKGYSDATRQFTARYLGTNLNLMLNLLTPSDPTVKPGIFEITPFAGVTFGHRYSHKGLNSYSAFGANGGLILGLKMSERVGFFVEGSATVYPNDFDGYVGPDATSEVNVQLLGGLSFKLGQYIEKPCDPISCDELDALNDQINRLRNKVEELKNRPLPECPECPECPPCPGIPLPNIQTPDPIRPTVTIKPEIKKLEPFFLPNPVFFRINKSVIDESEWERIELCVKHMEENPAAKVEVTGHADKQTGNPTINLRLSRERSQAVAKALVEKYGINPSRVSTNWKGDEAQPFIQNNDWNRVVIFRIIPN